MKQLFFLVFVSCLAHAAFGQVVNPPVIYQDTDIALHNTDVYYRPFAPPDSTDTRMGLSCLGSMDSNGIIGYYYPIFHGGKLADSHPCGDSLGDTIGNQVPWQRLFSANDKPSGAHSDIIAGGNPGDRVIISKNEDVDFRATGIIKLKSGFHAKPGCFFHAYTAPKFDTAVFTDDFDSTKFDRSKWYVSNGANGYNYNPIGNECSVDSNISMDTDYQARDGHVLDISLREIPDTCQCLDKNFDFFDSAATNVLVGGLPDTQKFVFSTAIVHSYKFPFQLPWYPNFPYGKYEVRDKVPIVEHHLNNWGGGAASEWDLCEKIGGGQFEFHSGISHKFLYGPFKGKFNIETFGTSTDTTFRSADAHWSLSNNPSLIVINGFSYEMGLNLYHDSGIYHVRDTFLTPAGLNNHFGIPASLKFSTDSFTFYYTKQTGNVTDTLPWYAGTDSSGKWRKLYVVYRFLNGDSLRFSKTYQPTTVTFDTGVAFDSSFHPMSQQKLNCHWAYGLNHPVDSGIIYLDDTMGPNWIHSGTAALTYTVDEGPDYPVPPIAFDTTKYQYHTFGMELLPHEMRILYDGNVRLRFPDRLIPPDQKNYDYISKLPRAPMDAYIGEFDIDAPSSFSDPLGTDTSGDWDGKPVSVTHQERKYFEWADTMFSHGCWDVQIPPGTGPWYHAAHHLIDYIDILDLPQGMKVAEYPH